MIILLTIFACTLVEKREELARQDAVKRGYDCCRQVTGEDGWFSIMDFKCRVDTESQIAEVGQCVGNLIVVTESGNKVKVDGNTFARVKYVSTTEEGD
jgi:hypothetical protein